jgi:hypothetical protein
VAHVGFKIFAALFYFVSGLVFRSDNRYSLTMITMTIISALDFWVVKNVTGRKLVGLRWWNIIKDDTGESEWRFEAFADPSTIDAMDRTVFWLGQAAHVLLWGTLSFFNLIGFSTNVLITGVVTTLGAVNFVGFWRCSADARSRLQNWATTQAVSHAISSRT